ncbi:MAG: zinc ribbon domain-containing protein [Phycisphaerales bacterium]|nr:zinc ribbon domain-containing protein [Phycisphaerales bacterium]
MNQPPVKVCVKCHKDCAALPRRRNDKGQYICLECLARVQGGDPGLALEDDAPPAANPHAPPRLCAGCGTVMGPGAVICSRCGLSSATGTYIGTGKAPGASGNCAKCGYPLSGLKSPVCPECGTVNSARSRRGAGARPSLFREEYLQPLIYLGVSALLMTYSLWGGVPDVMKALVLAGMVMLPLGGLLYYLCGMMWIGFDRPLRFVALRLFTALIFTDAVGLFSGDLAFFAFIRYGTMLFAMGYALYSLMDLDMADGVIVAALLMAATIGIHLTILNSL